jgi:hypothetical protein
MPIVARGKVYIRHTGRLICYALATAIRAPPRTQVSAAEPSKEAPAK